MSIKRDQTNRNEQSKVYIHFSSLLIFLYASLKIITLFIYQFHQFRKWNLDRLFFVEWFLVRHSIFDFVAAK